MKYIFSIVLLCIFSNAYSQSADVRAKAAFLKAQELYGSADYAGAIVKLDQVKELLGSTNPRVEYLLTQCHFQTKNIAKADEAIAAYFKLAADDDPNYMTMLQMIEEVDAVRAEYNKTLAEQEKIEAAWKQAGALNTAESYGDFIRRYPSSGYIKQAQAKLNNLPSPELYDERDGNTYATTWVNGKLWMAEDLKYIPLAKYDKKTGTYSYARNSAINACPVGWSLPSYEMIGEMVKSKIPTAQDVSNSGLWGKERLFTIVDKSHIAIFISSGWMIGGLDEFRLNLVKGGLTYLQFWTKEGAFRINQPGADIAIVIENYEFPKYEASPFRVGVCRCVKD